MQCLNPDPKANYKGIIDAFVKIVKNEGVFRPVRGMSVVAFGAGPAHALYFSCYEYIKMKYSGNVAAGDNSLTNGNSSLPFVLFSFDSSLFLLYSL